MAAALPATAATAAPASKLMPGKEKGSVTVASFEQVWRDNPGSIVVVDVRDAKEFAAGTMKGAINLPINDFEKKIGTLPTDRPVVFICGTGARSGEAHDMARLLRPELQAHFIDAHIKYHGDGSYTIASAK